MGGRRYGEGWKTWRWGGAGGGLRTGGSLGWGGQDPDFGGGGSLGGDPEGYLGSGGTTRKISGVMGHQGCPMGGDEGCPERPGYWEVLGHTGRVPGDTGPPGGWCVTLVLGGGVSPQVGGGWGQHQGCPENAVGGDQGSSGGYWDILGGTRTYWKGPQRGMTSPTACQRTPG